MKDKNSLEGWQNAINASRKQAQDEDEKWRLELGEPTNTIKTEDGTIGFWKIHGNPDQVLVTRIGPRGAVRTSASYYDCQMIEMLMSTLKDERR